MKAILSTLAASCLAACAMPAAPAIPTLAMLDFTGPADLAEEAGKLGLLLNVNLSQTEGLILVERAEITSAMSELELGLSGTLSPESTAKIGHMLGAKILVTGKLALIGKTRMAAAKIIGVETGKVITLAQEYDSADTLSRAATGLSGQIVKTVQEQLPGLVAAQESWEQRLARLKAGLPPGKTLPKVRVSIPEQHLSSPVPDPAAQTEIQKLLQDLGFQVVDEGAADYVITGEAFSEAAGRRGNFVSCRARVEVKASAAGEDGIWVDRQVRTSLDTAEHIAGKNALQDAGLVLAERLVTQYLVEKLK